MEFKTDCVGTFVDEEGLETDRVWSNSMFHFDDIGNALLTLFITVTQDGYNNILMDAMSITEKDRQPRHMANPGAFFYFMAFIMVCAFCLLNLYVGVVFYQFSRIRLLSQTGSAFLTSHQQVKLQLLMNWMIAVAGMVRAHQDGLQIKANNESPCSKIYLSAMVLPCSYISNL